MDRGLGFAVMLALVGYLLAGCLSGDDLQEDAEEDDLAGDGGLQVGPDETLLHGRALNDGLEPIQGARVIERSTGHNATTDEEGWYELRDVGEGEQTFIVEASGHAPLVEEVTVLVGELTRKDFLMKRVRGADPYVELNQQKGLLECQVGLVVLLANCIPIQNVLNMLGTNPTDTRQIHKWDIDPVDGLEAIVLEMVWEPSGLTTAEEMVFLVEPDGSGVDGGDWGREQGPPVIKYVITDNEILGEMKGAAEDDEPYQTRVFPPSELGNLVYQQVFEIFASHFYHTLPSDDYSAVPEDYVP